MRKKICTVIFFAAFVMMIIPTQATRAEMAGPQPVKSVEQCIERAGYPYTSLNDAPHTLVARNEFEKAKCESECRASHFQCISIENRRSNESLSAHLLRCDKQERACKARCK